MHNTNNTGRYDLRLPDYVIESLQLDKALEPILTRLATIMGSPMPQIRTQNVIFVPVGECSGVCSVALRVVIVDKIQ